MFGNFHDCCIVLFDVQGIPYAVAPVGELRWREALPVSDVGADCLSEVSADSYGSKCVQLDSSLALTGSEDCLFLNIWTPADMDVSASHLDVMVNVHDGGLMTGSGHEPCKSLVFSCGICYSDIITTA